MPKDKKKNSGTLQREESLRLVAERTAVQPDPIAPKDRVEQTGLHEEPESLFSGIHTVGEANTATRQDQDADKELASQIDWLHGQVKDISNLNDGDQLTRDQTEILRRYLALKESEVRDLKDQHQQYRTFITRVSSELEKANNRIRDLLSDLEGHRSSEESLRKELRTFRSQHDQELLKLKSEYEEQLKKGGRFESEVEDLVKKRDQWREHVKEELKRIKLKERELENRNELLKRDMQALLDSKDKHALDLKRKNDALELEMETLEEKLLLASRKMGAVESKKRRLVDTMKLALNLLETIDQEESSPTTAENDSIAGKGRRKAG